MTEKFRALQKLFFDVREMPGEHRHARPPTKRPA
jgi:hypothetical protein